MPPVRKTLVLKLTTSYEPFVKFWSVELLTLAAGIASILAGVTAPEAIVGFG
jgi:hypothetical protein